VRQDHDLDSRHTLKKLMASDQIRPKSNKFLTSLHSKGHSYTKENDEDHKGQQPIRGSHVVFIGGCNDYQGKYHGTSEFSKKA
jgi:hypothetical protein